MTPINQSMTRQTDTVYIQLRLTKAEKAEMEELKKEDGAPNWEEFFLDRVRRSKR